MKSKSGDRREWRRRNRRKKKGKREVMEGRKGDNGGRR